MTIPIMHNCEHMEDGVCLVCVRKLVEVERDACAQICEEAMRRRFAEAESPVRTSFGKDLAKSGGCMAEELAAHIRARSNASLSGRGETDGTE